MVNLRITTRDGAGLDGAPALGRGYEMRDDEGAVLGPERLRPESFEEVAVVGVAPSSVEERQALASPVFGLDRPVTLRVAGDGVAVLDAEGSLQGGWVAEETSSATAELLEREPGLEAWVSWEWLAETGRRGVDVALSRPELVPRPLGPPPQVTGGRVGGGLAGALGGRRAWVALGALAVAVVVVALALWG